MKTLATILVMLLLQCVTACKSKSSNMGIIIVEQEAMLQKQIVDAGDTLLLTSTISGKLLDKRFRRSGQRYSTGVRYDTTNAGDSSRYIMLLDSIVYQSTYLARLKRSYDKGQRYLISTDYLIDNYCPGAEYDFLFTPLIFEDSIKIQLSIQNWDKSFRKKVDTVAAGLQLLTVRAQLPRKSRDTVEVGVRYLSCLTGSLKYSDTSLVVHYLDECD